MQKVSKEFLDANNKMKECGVLNLKKDGWLNLTLMETALSLRLMTLDAKWNLLQRLARNQ